MAFEGEISGVNELNREKTALTAFNGKNCGFNGNEPEKQQS